MYGCIDYTTFGVHCTIYHSSLKFNYFFATLAWLIPLNVEQMCLEDVLDDLDGGGRCQVSQTGGCQTATSPFLLKKEPSHHHNKKKWDRSGWSA